MARKTKSSALPDMALVITATFEMIAEKGLEKTRMTALAEHFSVPLPEFHAAYPSVAFVIQQFLDQIDHYIVQNFAESSSKRDVYFDMLMNRFDKLQEHRAGVKRWLADTAKHPALLASLLKRWEKTLSLMLDLAKDSPVYPMKKIGLAAVYAYSLREWVRDDSSDMAKTMTAVDRALGRADDFVARFMTRKKPVGQTQYDMQS